MSDRIDDLADRWAQFRQQWYATPVLLVAIFLFLIILPWIRNYALFGFAPIGWLSVNILVITLIWATTAQAWNIMSGYTGQFSFGHAAFFGIGAYATIILIREFALSPWIGMLVGSVIAAGYGLLIGVLTFRYDLEGHYFALATLAFAVLLRFLFNNIAELGSASGFFKPLPRTYADGPGLAAFQFLEPISYYYVILAFLVIISAISWVVHDSKLGLHLFAIREDEDAAAAVGVPTYQYKLLGISLSAFLTAWPGAFWAMYFDTIRPDTVFDLLVNVEILLPAIVGGVGTVLGPIVGSFVVTPVSELARQSFELEGLNTIIYGFILILIVLYSPRGVVSWPGRARELLFGASERREEEGVTPDGDD